GEAGEKGFLMWDVAAGNASCRLEPTPARRTLDICFAGKPDLEALRAAVERQPIAGAWVRVRWSVAEEEHNDVDRGAIQSLLDGAAAVQLEGRVLPAVRVRGGGLARAPALHDKVRIWAGVVDASPEP